MNQPRPDSPTHHPSTSQSFLLRVNAAAAICPIRGTITPASALLWVSSPQTCWFSEGNFASRGAQLGTPDPLGGRKPANIELLALDTPAAISSHPRAAEAKLILDRTSRVLIPGLVNAHTHLDLTHIGPIESDPVSSDPTSGFIAFIELIRSQRFTQPNDIAHSVALGARMLIQSGTIAVGDIAGTDTTGCSLTPWKVLCASPLAGVSFTEFFGLTSSAAATLPARLSAFFSAANQAKNARVRLGLQPHAPYSVGPDGYAFAFDKLISGLPVSTHLAETIEEREFVTQGTGPIRDFLIKLNLASPELDSRFGLRRSPVATIMADLAAAQRTCPAADGPLLVHLADVSDADLDLLQAENCHVVYCPRSAAYFKSPAHLGPHRFETMLARGINVCLGTDSVVNIPKADLDLRGLSVLDEARLLIATRGISRQTAIAMCTTNGAKALGLTFAGFNFEPGPLAGLIAADLHGFFPISSTHAKVPAADELLLLGETGINH